MALYRNIAGFDEQSGEFTSLLGPTALQPYMFDSTIDLKPLIPKVHYDPAVAVDPPSVTIPTQDPILTPTTEIPISATNTNGIPQVLPVPETAQDKMDWLPLVTLGGLIATIFLGERYIPKKQKIVFVAGLGALYYQFSKKS